jgi:integrase
LGGDKALTLKFPHPTRGARAVTFLARRVERVQSLRGARDLGDATVHGTTRLLRPRPCNVSMLKASATLVKFYDFDEYRRFIEAARAIDARTHLVGLLGGDAGLRRGEMLALRWADVDFGRRQLQVQEAVWERKRRDGKQGHERITDTPKGGRSRVIPLTNVLFEALRRHRHLRGEYVLYGNDGQPVTSSFLRRLAEAAQRRAGLRSTGGIHILRHTFCSHLAMRGAPAKAIQELAGHADLTTTMRYMHLSPAARQGAIELLNAREQVVVFGEMVETAPGGSLKHQESRG